MPNLAYPSTSLSSRHDSSGETRKWTVSPEFGDALMTAMRERTESGGPLPRLPSLLQLPSQEPNSSPKRSEQSLENIKLTMKTRVAVRDKTPHRFQVVPLREIGSLALPATNTTPKLKAQRGARLDINRSRTFDVNANTAVPVSPSKSKQSTQESRVLSEVNQNTVTPLPSCPAIGIQLPSPTGPLVPGDEQSTPTRRSLILKEPAKSRPAHRSSTPAPRSILRSRNSTTVAAEPKTASHFKSPSLGNMRIKPSLSYHADCGTPRKTRQRHKRTNTLSVDSPTRPVAESRLMPRDRRRALDDNPSKRHAIYTQSLYVPHDEHESLSKQYDLNDTLKKLAPNELLAPSNITGQSHFINTLGFLKFPLHQTIFPTSYLTRGLPSDSQSSISSIYSQDGLSLNSQAMLIQTRPLTHARRSSDFQHVINRRPKEAGIGIEHHPIIAGLIAEVDDLIIEWSVSEFTAPLLL